MSVAVSHHYTVPGVFTPREVQVTCLQQLHRKLKALGVTPDILLSFTTPDHVVSIALTVEDGGDLLTTPWLSDAVMSTAGTDVVTSVVLAFTPTSVTVVTVGVNAWGVMEEASLFAGRNAANPLLNNAFKRYIAEQCKVIWGSTWLPLP